MIQDDIVKRILNGESIKLSIQSQNEKALEQFRFWLQGFRGTLPGSNGCIRCNFTLDSTGKETITMAIEALPHGYRELFASRLSEHGQQKDDPFTIQEVQSGASPPQRAL